MAEIETPAQFLKRTYVCSGCGENSYKCACETRPLLAEISARDTAVANRVLDELIALDDGSTETMPVYRAVALLRARYAQQGGG